MRAQRSTLERVSLSAGDIAPEADLSQMMMARRQRSGAAADRTAALEIVHSAAGLADSSLSDGLFFKKGFATAEGFRPSYWVYERSSEEAPRANLPKALPPSDAAPTPIAAIANLVLPDDAGDPDEAEDEGIAASPAAASDVEPEGDLSKIMIRRTPFLRSADCDPTLAPAIEAATKATVLDRPPPVDPDAAVAIPTPPAPAANPKPEAQAPAPIVPPPSPPSVELPKAAPPVEAPRAAPAPVTLPPIFRSTMPPPTPAPGTRGSIVTELTQVIESVLSSKSYASQQDAAALRTARERPDARQKGGYAPPTGRSVAAPAPAPIGAGARPAAPKQGGARIVTTAIWRIGRVSVLAILATLLAEYLLTSWLSGG